MLGDGTEFERCSFGQEFWLQPGEQVTQRHIDWQHNLACMPRCCRGAIKLLILFAERSTPLSWHNYASDEEAIAQAASRPDAVALLCLPGDVMMVPALAWHAVVTKYRKGACYDERWAMVGGAVVMLKTLDAEASLRFGCGGESGIRRLAPGVAQRYTETVLYPYWQLLHRGDSEFDASAALNALRAEVRPPGSVQGKRGGAAQTRLTKKAAKRAHARARGMASQRAQSAQHWSDALCHCGCNLALCICAPHWTRHHPQGDICERGE